jgi:hypothetical protein
MADRNTELEEPLFLDEPPETPREPTVQDTSDIGCSRSKKNSPRRLPRRRPDLRFGENCPLPLRAFACRCSSGWA